MHTIVVDIGNSTLRFGLFDGANCTSSWTVNSKPHRTHDELFAEFMTVYRSNGVDPAEVGGIIIGSVVPPLTYHAARALEGIHQVKPVIVDRHSPSTVNPVSHQIGTDIYANLVAAHQLYPPGKQIVVDFGTALTVACVDEDGTNRGVIIAPGVITSLKALVAQTAALPEVDLRAPASVLGLDTETCMQSGLIYGFLGMVEGLIARIDREMGGACLVIGTGGLSHIYQPLTDAIQVADKLHTLKGMYLLGAAAGAGAE